MQELDYDLNKFRAPPRTAQPPTRSKVRQQKLKYAFIGYIVVLVFLAITQFIGVGFFTSGFLLSRDVLPNIADCGDNSCVQPRFEKAVILVIDALRFDFAIPVADSQEYYHNNFPILYDLAQKDNGVLLKFIADPPTTTLQRLKGLTTGSLPTIIDAGSNFNGDAIDEDNWLLQLHKINKTIAFMGDDTWTALFNAYIHPDLNFPYDSLNVWDFHTVDNGVIEHLFPLMEKQNWDVLIGHFLGVDHVGHRYGPKHFSMKEKLNQMNDVVGKVVEDLDDDTLLVVFGDHGMDYTGNHGGDAPDELESTLFMYSKKQKFLKKEKGSYDITNQGANYRQVNQIDLVPTISLLLGLPIPFNNLGFTIDEAFGSVKEALVAGKLTIDQIKRFRDLTPSLSDSLLQRYDDLISAYKSKASDLDLIEQMKQYQFQSLEQCKTLWARFDLRFIGMGIVVLFLSLTFMITYARSIPAVRVSTLSFEFIGSVVAMSIIGVVLSFSIYIVLKPSDFTLKICLCIGAVLGMVVGFWAPIMDRFSVEFIWQQTVDFFQFNFNSWSFMGIVFVALHCLMFASNSYVVWEDKMVQFFLLSFGGSCVYALSVKTNVPREVKILGISHAITFLVLTRLASMVTACREEQRPYCETTFTTSWWSIIVLHSLAYLLPAAIKAFYRLSDSYYSAAPLWISTGLKFLLFMNAMYWTFEYVQNNEFFNSARFTISGPLLKSLKLAIARLVLFISLVLANFSWSRGPLCVKLELVDTKDSESSSDSDDMKSQRSASILGYGNVYGSSYFLLVLNFTVAVMLTTKPLGAVSISILIIQILSLLEMIDELGLRRNLISPIIFGLLGYQHFFSTGHQATIPSIQWELGFMTTETIVFPFTHLNIVLNTFGPFFLVALAVPLITIWKMVPSPKPITVLSQIITNITTLSTYLLFTGLSSSIFAAHFRRHLMMVIKAVNKSFLFIWTLCCVLRFCVSDSLYNSSFTPNHVRYLKNETKQLFQHAWKSYMTYGFPFDEVRPLTCEPYGPDYSDYTNTVRNDAMANISSTLLDNIDTLIIMEQWDDLESALQHLKDNQVEFFNQDSVVQVFETTIRFLGGLLSAHLILTDVTNRDISLPPSYNRFKDISANYNGFLLEMAYDLGLRLIPSYQTKTNIPFPRINLKSGLKKVPPALQKDACTSGVTTPVLEFTLLSKLTGDFQFEYYTQQSFWKLWSSKSALNLMPMSIDPFSNQWKDSITGIGASIDSFYEYAAKSAIIFNDNDMWSVFHASYKALLTHSAQEFHGTMIFPNVGTEDGILFGDWIDSLGAFWSGLQVLTGHLTHAIKTHVVYLKIWDYFDSIPERWIYVHHKKNKRKRFKTEDSIALEWYPLRPEFIESTYYLYRATKDPMYLHIGERILELFKTKFRAQCGFSGIQNINTGERQNRMETFVLGETLKYLYLLFDEEEKVFLHRPELMGSKNWVFSTEAHPLWFHKGLKSLQNSKFKANSAGVIPADITEDQFTPAIIKNTTLREPRVYEIPGHDSIPHVGKKDPFGDRLHTCELNPLTKSTTGLLESSYYSWQNLFGADYLYAKSLIKPLYSNQTNLDGSYIELNPSFFAKFAAFDTPLTSQRMPSTTSYEVFWGDIKDCEFAEVSELTFVGQNTTESIILPGDLWIPALSGLRIVVEELTLGSIDSRNAVVTDEYISRIKDDSFDDNSKHIKANEILRILRVNGVKVSQGAVIWTLPFEPSPREKGAIRITAEGRVVIQGKVVENLIVCYDPIHDTYTPSKPKDPQSSPPNSIQRLDQKQEHRGDPLSISSLVSEEETSPNDPVVSATPSRISNAHKVSAISNLIEAQVDNEGEDEDDDTDVNSTIIGDDDDYTAPSASSHKPKKKSSSKKKKKSNIANSKLSLKKGDGEPFWRRDIQYDLLTALFDDKTACFTNTYPQSNLTGVNNNHKITFAELYIRTLAESNKSSKVLKEKLLRDFDLGKAVSKVCVLVNAGRMNTTINFVHDMKSTLRTYHSIPCLQTGPSGGTIRQLQDTPRLKSIIKAVNEGQENKVTSLEELVKLPPSTKPNTDIVQLLFLLSEANNGIPFIKDSNFHLLDLFVNTKVTPQSRAKKLLWLFYTFLETDFTPEQLTQNPFGGATIPTEEQIPASAVDEYDVDPQYEIDYASEMLQARKQYLSEDHSNDGAHVSQRTQDTRAGLSSSTGPKVNNPKKREAKTEEAEEGEKKVSKVSQPKKKQKKTHPETSSSSLSKSIVSLNMRSSQAPATTDGNGEEKCYSTSTYNVEFPIKDIANLASRYTVSESVSTTPDEEESIEFKCDLVEVTNPMVQEVRTSSKASTASFNKKITILGNWLYRYFKYKKSIANKFVGLEWEDIRHDLVSGVETYLYETFGKSLNTSKILNELDEDDEGSNGIGTADEVYFNYISVGDYDKANEKKSFLLHLTTFANDYFITKLEKKLKHDLTSNVRFDLENEAMFI
ncbi:GPI13 [Candida margitis]|uniref:GPI13 n=1 Tax=Candida margitis TaxID=1775924 RepID=UPI002225E016|nr:GPI13 [Candida margitis]KAI5954048.1 GPI13 [Candida margitis]